MESDDIYTHGHHASVLRSHTWRTAHNSAAYLLEHLTTTDRLLDVGCGPGTISMDLAQRLPEGHVVGIDSSSEVIALAQEAAVSQRVHNVEFAVEDIYGLPYEDDTFDVVHAHQVLQHLGRPVDALKEMQRVCRPGGLVAARDADYPAMAWYPANVEMDHWMDVFCRTTVANGGHPDAARKLLSWAHQAGFAVVAPSASTWCFATVSDRPWWGELWAERITESIFAERSVELGFATSDELSEMARGWRTWADDPDGWFAIIHGEILCTTAE
jgi:ubiquinone/menaquinone biosynthesis C-methylase UbiE